MSFVSRIRRNLQKFSRRAVSSVEAEKQNPFAIRGLEKFEKTLTELAEKRHLVAEKTRTKASRVRFSPGCKKDDWIPIIPSKSTDSDSQQHQYDDASSSVCKENTPKTSEETVSVTENSEQQHVILSDRELPVDVVKRAKDAKDVILSTVFLKVSLGLAFTGRLSSIVYALNQICRQISYRITAFLITAFFFCVERLAMLEMITDAVGGFCEIFRIWQKNQFSHTNLAALIIARRRLPSPENSTTGSDFDDDQQKKILPSMQKLENTKDSSFSSFSPSMDSSFDLSTTTTLSPTSSSKILDMESEPVTPRFSLLRTDHSPEKAAESRRFGSRSLPRSFNRKRIKKTENSATSAPITPRNKLPVLTSRFKAAAEKLRLRSDQSTSFSRLLSNFRISDLKNASLELSASSLPPGIDSRRSKQEKVASFSDHKANNCCKDQANHGLSNPKLGLMERKPSISRASSLKKMERKPSIKQSQKALQSEGATSKAGMLHDRQNSSATISVGLILILVLSSLLMGHFTSILCTSCSLLVISNLKMLTLNEKSLRRYLPRTNSIYIDYTSSEYKKKVVMEGLLARNPGGFVRT